MKIALLHALLAAVVLLPMGCGSKGGDPTPTPPIVPTTEYKAASGTFTIQPNQGPTYTVSKLTLKTESIELAASKESHIQYTYRGLASDGKYAQITLYITQPSPLSGNGPWPQQATIYSTTSTYSQLTLVGYAYGSVSGANGVYTADFSGALVRGALLK